MSEDLAIFCINHMVAIFFSTLEILPQASCIFLPLTLHSGW